LFQIGRASVEKENFELGRFAWDSCSKGMLHSCCRIVSWLCFWNLSIMFVFSSFYYLLAISCLPFKFLFHVVCQHAYRDQCPFQNGYALLEPVSFIFLNYR
jgi:hypothetical protein